MTAVIYARYSSDNQREESIEGQIRECTAYAEKNGITIVKHYIDRAISAKTDNRPEFQQKPSITNQKAQELCGFNKNQTYYILHQMCKDGILQPDGVGRGTKYKSVK